MDGAMKVGALAARTGLTVRTLHHYDEIGLLTPAGRTPSGHRLYGPGEVRRLQQIASLRHLGLPLDEIRDCLSRPGYSLDRVLALQIDRLDEQISRDRQLRDLLAHLREGLDSDEGASLDQLTRAIEASTSYVKYVTPDQMEALEKRRIELGEERMRQVEQEWADLFAAFADAMDRGLDPSGREVRALARRSRGLIRDFTGGDPELYEALGRMYTESGPDALTRGAPAELAPGLWEYVGRAGAALEEDDGSKA